jgi:FkbM family methyltransferase
MNYQGETKYLDRLVGGHGGWVWPIADTAHVFETLARDWETRHSDAFAFATPSRRGVCIQAGGNCGMYPRLLAGHFKRVYTFEPDPLNFYCLVNNCQQDNIFKMQAALGAGACMAQVVRRVPSNIGGHVVVYGEGALVPVLTIDSLGLDSCDFIQLDVEGHERAVLIGAEATIKKFKPVISAERADTSIDQFLRMFGYSRIDVAIEDVIYRAQ